MRRIFTTRRGGVSQTPYDSFNLGGAVGDDPGCGRRQPRAAGRRRRIADQPAGLDAAGARRDSGQRVGGRSRRVRTDHPAGRRRHRHRRPWSRSRRAGRRLRADAGRRSGRRRHCGGTRRPARGGGRYRHPSCRADDRRRCIGATPSRCCSVRPSVGTVTRFRASCATRSKRRCRVRPAAPGGGRRALTSGPGWPGSSVNLGSARSSSTTVAPTPIRSCSATAGGADRPFGRPDLAAELILPGPSPALPARSFRPVDQPGVSQRDGFDGGR